MNLHKFFEKHGGINNVIILAPCRPLKLMLDISWTSSPNVARMLPCKVVEKRYKVKDGYKIQLECLLPEFSGDTYYQSDFNGIMRAGHIKVLQDHSNKFASE